VTPDAQLQADVAEELFRDLRVDDDEVAVKAEHGTVTLRGTVGSLGAKRAAGKDARRASGVLEVHNELQVRLLTEHRRTDAELRGSVLKVLSWNAVVPGGVDAAVRNGEVTLTGEVDHRFQREEAEATLVNLRGVTEIHNELKVRNSEMAEEVSARIEEAFERNAHIDARAIRVEALDGTVTLKGLVNSWFERNAAIDAAWTAAGVESVDDQLGIAG
jgi:osmotically-inducible protein OsmY